MDNIIRSWSGRTIRQREDGYWSATDMCQSCGKLFADWFRLKTTTEYLETASSIMGIPIMLDAPKAWCHNQVFYLPKY